MTKAFSTGDGKRFSTPEEAIAHANKVSATTGTIIAVEHKMTERDEAIAKLREWIKPGDTVYTVLDAVSRSGMSREIRVVLLQSDDGKCVDIHPNWAVGKALGLRHARHNGYERDALVVGGAGMDMGFHVVYQLSHTLYPTYQCIGKKARCPSNVHVNSGPEREKYGARITHEDGYALKHRWL